MSFREFCCSILLMIKIFKKKKKRVFLDYASITPVAEEVLGEMQKCARGNFANPSALYEEGREAKEMIKSARGKIAGSLGARTQEIIFTSGGTESDNMAILGVFESARRSGVVTPHIVTTKIEHPAVLEACHEVERRGGEVTYLPVSEEGLIRVADVAGSLKDTTVLVSVMMANNEIGTIQPIAEIGKVIKKYRDEKIGRMENGIESQRNAISAEGHASTKDNLGTGTPFFHSDACQAILYEKIDVAKLSLDFLTLDGIKMYGPRGIGLLYRRLGLPMLPLFFGGGQESGLRSGTENLPAIVGLAKAFEIADRLRESESARLSKIRDYGIAEILENFPEAKLNGSSVERLPNNINICFPNLDSEFLVVALDVEGVALSHSSTCRTLKEDSSSYVVEALGRNDCAMSSLRITLGRGTQKKDTDTLIKALKKVINLV